MAKAGVCSDKAKKSRDMNRGIVRLEVDVMPGTE